MADNLDLGDLRIPVEFDLGPLEKQAKGDLKRRADRIAKERAAAFRATADEASNLAKRTEDAQAGLRGFVTLIAVRVTTALRGFVGMIARAGSSLLDLTSFALLGVSRGLRAASAQLAESENGFRHLATPVRAAASGLEAFAKVALTVSGVILGLQVATGLLAARMVVAAHRAAADFGPAWARVRTALGDSENEFKSLRSEISDMAGAIGEDGVEAVDTFYKVIGAMPQLLREPRRALGIMRVSLEAASTGFTNAAQAAEAITAILNAFGLEAEEARRVSDALFAAQDLGVLTFGEIAASIGTVSGLTASLNGEFEDLLGIAATLTPLGTSVAEVFQGVRSAISNVLKPSEAARAEAERLGIEFNAAALEAKGLNGFLLDIIETTGGDTDVLAKFFGSQQALSLIVSLAQQTEALRERTAAIGDAAGTTARNVEIVNDTWERQADILGNRLSAALRRVGFEFEEFGITGLKALNGMVGAMERFIEAAADMPTLGAFGLPLVESVSQRFGIGGGAAVNISRAELERLLFPPAPPRPRTPRLATAPPIARPAEPLSVQFSRERIEELRQLREATAVVDFARTGDIEAYEAAIRGAQEAVNALVLAEIERLRAGGVAEGELAQLAGLYDVGAERARRFAEAGRAVAARVGELNPEIETTRSILPGLVPPSFWTEDGPQMIDGLTEATRDYDRTLLDLREQLARGTIDGEEFGERSAEAAAEFNARVLELIDHWRELGKLTPERAAELIGALKVGGKEADNTNKKLEEQARTLVSVARGVLSVVDAMGALDDQTRRTLQGVIELGEGIAQIASGNVVGGSIQVFGGLVSTLSGLLSSNDEAERERLEVIRRNTEALRRLTEATLAGVTAGERASLVSGGRRLLELMEAGPEAGVAALIGGLDEATIAMLERIEEITGADFFDPSGGFDIEEFRRALDALAAADFGFADTVIGQLDALDFVFAALGDAAGTAAERMERFIAVLAGMEETAGFAEELQRILDTQGPEAAREFINGLIEAFARGGVDDPLIRAIFGTDITDAEFRRVIEEALGFLGGPGGLVGGGATETRLAVNITEEQANRLLALESTQLFHLAAIHAILAGTGVPVPAAMPAVARPSTAQVAGGGGVRIDVGAVEIHLAGTPSTLDRAGLVDAGRAAGTAFNNAATKRLRAAHRGRGGISAPRVRVDVQGVR